MAKWQHEGSMHVFSKKGNGGPIIIAIIAFFIIAALVAG